MSLLIVIVLYFLYYYYIYKCQFEEFDMKIMLFKLLNKYASNKKMWYCLSMVLKLFCCTSASLCSPQIKTSNLKLKKKIIQCWKIYSLGW